MLVVRSRVEFGRARFAAFLAGLGARQILPFVGQLPCVGRVLFEFRTGEFLYLSGETGLYQSPLFFRAQIAGFRR